MSTVTKISDLKYQLREGALRTNKFLVELSINGVNGAKLNVLCKQVSFPERTINSTDVWYHGRKYVLRAETDYGNTCEMTVLDDSTYNIRRALDALATQIDDSSRVYKPDVGSFQTKGGTLSELNPFKSINRVIDLYKDIQTGVGALTDRTSGPGLLNSASSLIDETLNNPANAPYQTEMNIWQLNGNGEKVYGYQLQNVWLAGIGTVQYGDDIQDTIVEYPVTWKFSEFVALGYDNDKILNTAASAFGLHTV